jgi:hypothetical protein
MSGSVGASEAQASGATRPRMLPLSRYAETPISGLLVLLGLIAASLVLPLKNPIHVGHSTGGEVARYLERPETNGPRVDHHACV